jgi:hypothetical protein
MRRRKGLAKSAQRVCTIAILAQESQLIECYHTNGSVRATCRGLITANWKTTFK